MAGRRFLRKARFLLVVLVQAVAVVEQVVVVEQFEEGVTRGMLVDVELHHAHAVVDRGIGGAGRGGVVGRRWS
jgi:hypothetical protein